jgi:hypothetical protein
MPVCLTFQTLHPTYDSLGELFSDTLGITIAKVTAIVASHVMRAWALRRAEDQRLEKAAWSNSLKRPQA